MHLLHTFQHPPRNFEGFPSGFPNSRFNDRFGQPMQQRFQQQARASPPPQQQHHYQPRSNADSNDRSDSIPIKVVHMGHKKHPVGGSPRNTTQLPARGSPKQTPLAAAAAESPRLERSASEPPKVFNQRLQRPPMTSATIPESGTPPKTAGERPGLRVPEAAHHNLSTSASAPSVPMSQQEQEAAAAAAGAPMPPPRRPSPTKPRQQEDPQQQQQQVRHIPIFVEGRNDPVYSSKLGREDSVGEHRKPSDFYPPGVTKVKPPQRQQEVERPSGLNVNQRRQQQQQRAEPTSPEGPPPGPIPMGCSESHVKPAEPTSPMPVEEGVVIPLPCSPDLYNNQPSGDSSVDGVNSKPKGEEARKVPVEEASEASAPKQQRKPSKEEMVQGQIEKVQTQVAELAARIAAFRGDKKDKEYLYLDEMLTRHMLSLDGVETNGNEELRKMRKESIRSINRCLSMLDSKAKGGEGDNAEQSTDKIIDALAEKSEEVERGISKMDVEDGGGK